MHERECQPDSPIWGPWTAASPPPCLRVPARAGSGTGVSTLQGQRKAGTRSILPTTCPPPGAVCSQSSGLFL